MPISFNPNPLFVPSESVPCHKIDTTHTIDIRLKPLGSKKLCITHEVRAAQINCAARGMRGGMRHHFFHTNNPSELLHDITVFGMDIAMPLHQQFMSVVDTSKKDLKNNFERFNQLISDISIIRGKPIIAVDQEKAFIQSGCVFDLRTLQINGYHKGLRENLGKNTIALNGYKHMRDCNFHLAQEGYSGSGIPLEPIESAIHLEEDLRHSAAATSFQLNHLLFDHILPNSAITPITSGIDIISPNIREFSKEIEITEDLETKSSRKRQDFSVEAENMASHDSIEHLDKKSRLEQDDFSDSGLLFDPDTFFETDFSFNADTFFDLNDDIEITINENKGKLSFQGLNSAGLAIINDNSRIVQHLAARRLILAQAPFKNQEPINITKEEIQATIEWMKTQPMAQLLKNLLLSAHHPTKLSAHQAESVIGLEHKTLRDNYYHTTGLVFGFTRPDTVQEQNTAIEKMTALFYTGARQKLPAVTVSLEKWAEKTQTALKAKDTAAIKYLP
jgi:hypothetical protein